MPSRSFAVSGVNRVAVTCSSKTYRHGYTVVKFAVLSSKKATLVDVGSNRPDTKVVVKNPGFALRELRRRPSILPTMYRDLKTVVSTMMVPCHCSASKNMFACVTQSGTPARWPSSSRKLQRDYDDYSISRREPGSKGTRATSAMWDIDRRLMYGDEETDDFTIGLTTLLEYVSYSI